MQSFIRSNVSINNFKFIIIFKHFEFKYTCTHALSYYEHKLTRKGVTVHVSNQCKLSYLNSCK